MNGINKNIIRKQVVEFNISSNASAFQLQQQAGDWCNQQLLPYLQERLEPYALTPAIIRIDQLLIEIEHTGLEFDQQLLQKIGDELERKLTEQQEQQGNETIIEKPEKRWLHLLLFYLQHGHLPWWSNIVDKTTFEQQLHQWLMQDMQAPEITRLKQTLQQELAAKRLLSIVPHDYLWILFEKIAGGTFIQNIKAVFQQLQQAIGSYESPRLAGSINTVNEMIREVVAAALLEWITHNRFAIRTFPLGAVAARVMQKAGYTTDDIHLIYNEPTLSGSGTFDVTFDTAFTEGTPAEQSLPPAHSADEGIAAPEPAKKPARAKEEEEIYISNAGLVLAARYLADFFERTGLRQNKQFVHPALAVASLQWMATGSETPAEFELVSPRILCGIQVQEQLPQVKEIPAFIRQEATELLESLIKHWSVLQNTSVQGLREAFLQRHGKLSRVKDKWLLQVQQKPYDMLLEQLPWTIGIIKLSFMKEALFVEWT